MKRIAISTLVLALAASSLLAGCDDGPVGSYLLDKEDTESAMRQRYPKDFAYVGVKVTLVLSKGGDYRAEWPSSSPLGGTESGTWKADGEKLKLKGSEREITCRLIEEKHELECNGDPTGGAILGDKDSATIFMRY